MEDGFAIGLLSATGAIVDTDEVQIGSVYYRWTSGSVNAGTPAGTATDPWLVALGSSNAEALDNLRGAVGNTGVPGVTYSLLLVEHPLVLPRSSTANSFSVQAKDAGSGGNSIVTTETGADIQWASGTLTGGGTDSVTPVPLPDDLAAIAVDFIAGYVIVVPDTRNTSFSGRFFWIEPGETFIRDLNFATAERSPDPLLSVRTVGDQFWLFGTNTSEVWYPTGDLLTPFIRIQGQTFTRGVIEGTDLLIKDQVILVDQDGVVYLVTGGGPQRVSDSSVEERIRRAIRAEQLL
jgi:hypothetical protein